MNFLQREKFLNGAVPTEQISINTFKMLKLPHPLGLAFAVTFYST